MFLTATIRVALVEVHIGHFLELAIPLDEDQVREPLTMISLTPSLNQVGNGVLEERDDDVEAHAAAISPRR